jgi:hypothetical protein
VGLVLGIVVIKLEDKAVFGLVSGETQLVSRLCTFYAQSHRTGARYRRYELAAIFEDIRHTDTPDISI